MAAGSSPVILKYGDNFTNPGHIIFTPAWTIGNNPLHPNAAASWGALPQSLLVVEPIVLTYYAASLQASIPLIILYSSTVMNHVAVTTAIPPTMPPFQIHHTPSLSSLSAVPICLRLVHGCSQSSPNDSA